MVNNSVLVEYASYLSLLAQVCFRACAANAVIDESVDAVDGSELSRLCIDVKV